MSLLATSAYRVGLACVLSNWRCAAWSNKKHVGKHKSSTLHDFSNPHGDRPRENRSVINKGVKFAIFAAWVGFGGKIGQQAEVVVTPGKAFCNLRGVYACNLLHASRDHLYANLSSLVGTCHNGNKGSSSVSFR
jgi:hypothetical protein